MTVINRKKFKNFVTISNTAFKDKELSLKAKGLLGVVMTLPDNWNFTICGIATCLKESTSAISAAIKELTAAGYCVRGIVYDESHKIQGYSYTFSDEKELLVNDDETEKPSEENPSTENRKQYNNNIKKILKNDKEKDTKVSKKPFSYSSVEEERFYTGMETSYPFVAKMQFPLLYQDYVGLLAKYSQQKIHSNLRKINNWKELNKKYRYAKDVLEDWLARDKNEY